MAVGLAVIVASYVVGALPIGLLVAKWWRGIDVRDHGSGNIGATNVYRVVGPAAGVVVFALDVLKGLWPPLVERALGQGIEWQVASGLVAIAGHNWSPFLGFQGGKGIATSLGVLFGVGWKTGAAAFALWAVTVLATGYVSVASILASASLAPFMALFYPGQAVLIAFGALAGGVAIYKHRANIRRLLDGTESNFRKKKPA